MPTLTRENNFYSQAVKVLFNIHLVTKVKWFSILDIKVGKQSREKFSPPEKLEVGIVCVAQ